MSTTETVEQTKQTDEQAPNLYLHKVQMENLMRLTSLEVEIDRENHLVIVGGRNAQGKTSFMDGIENAFSKGKPSERPIHDGAKEAKDEIWLCDDDGTPVYIVRKIIRKTKTEYTLADAQTGEELPGLWEFIDSLTDKGFGYDPAAFAEWGKTAPGRRQQFETLRKLAGLDFSDLDTEREKVYNERTGVKKLAERLQAQLYEAPAYPQAPKEKVDVQSLSGQHTAAVQQQDALRSLRERFGRRNERKEEIIRQIDALQAEMEGIDREMTAIRAEGKALKASAVDPAPLFEQLTQAGEVNRQVEANARHAQLQADAKAEDKKVEQLTKRLEEIDAERARRMQAAEMPLPGLALAEDGETVLFEGKPLNVASSAEQLRVSTAVGIKTLKRLRLIIIRNGSFLDRQSRREIAEMARAHKVQVFMEVVGVTGSTFAIENGELADEETIARLLEEERGPAE